MIREWKSTDIRLDRLAEVVVDYSTRVKPGDRVVIEGEPVATPTISAIYRKILLRKAYPVPRIRLSELNQMFYDLADTEQLTHVFPIEIADAEVTDVRIVVISESNVRALSGVPAERLAKVRSARAEIHRILKDQTRWNICVHPTDAYAQEAGMSRYDFREFIYRACLLNHEQPVTAWQEYHSLQQRAVDALQGSKTIRIKAPGTDLRLSVAGRTICQSCGEVNMPDGELYSGPREDSVEGTVCFSYPGEYKGKYVRDIQLRLAKGRVVEANASAGQELLDNLLATDEGARHFGEIGIGTNYGIREFTHNMLFDEKIGGTVHLALGDSYRETGGQNRSALHWDLLVDMRSDGELYFDDILIQKNGIFTGPLAGLFSTS